MNSRQGSVTDGWDKLEDATMPITDVGVVSKREKTPDDYTVIENTYDGKKANFPEGLWSTRYICYTKKEREDYPWVVTDLKVISRHDRPPPGYMIVTHNMDDGEKAFHSKLLLLKFVAQDKATEGITDIIVLSSHHKERVPPKYKRLPEINGLSICFKLGPVPRVKGHPVQPEKRSSSRANAQPRPSHTSTTPISNGEAHPIRPRAETASVKVRKAIDGLVFQLAEQKDLTSHFKLEESLEMLSLQDIEEKYTLDFSKWKLLANSSK